LGVKSRGLTPFAIQCSYDGLGGAFPPVSNRAEVACSLWQSLINSRGDGLSRYAGRDGALKFVDGYENAHVR